MFNRIRYIGFLSLLLFKKHVFNDSENIDYFLKYEPVNTDNIIIFYKNNKNKINKKQFYNKIQNHKNIDINKINNFILNDTFDIANRICMTKNNFFEYLQLISQFDKNKAIEFYDNIKYFKEDYNEIILNMNELKILYDNFDFDISKTPISQLFTNLIVNDEEIYKYSNFYDSSFVFKQIKLLDEDFKYLCAFKKINIHDDLKNSNIFFKFDKFFMSNLDFYELYNEQNIYSLNNVIIFYNIIYSKDNFDEHDFDETLISNFRNTDLFHISMIYLLLTETNYTKLNNIFNIFCFSQPKNSSMIKLKYILNDIICDFKNNEQMEIFEKF